MNYRWLCKSYPLSCDAITMVKSTYLGLERVVLIFLKLISAETILINHRLASSLETYEHNRLHRCSSFTCDSYISIMKMDELSAMENITRRNPFEQTRTIGKFIHAEILCSSWKQALGRFRLRVGVELNFMRWIIFTADTDAYEFSSTITDVRFRTVFRCIPGWVI